MTKKSGLSGGGCPHLEEAGRQDLLPKRDGPLDRAALREPAAGAEVLLRAVKVRELDQRRLLLPKAEPLLVKLDEDLLTTAEKTGRDAAECWVDLTDCLRRPVLLFSHGPVPTGSRGHPDLTVVLDRLSEFEKRTGVGEWQVLAVQIRSAYELAEQPSSGCRWGSPSPWHSCWSAPSRTPGRSGAMWA
ncbi:hypothetical protein [Streptomyces sp. NPDC005970]|uniref:hypothetical protein n=1 Tax=Streptomyces sp. NPDC005970 TaxID=3156723 RepID=UPI0033FF013A